MKNEKKKKNKKDKVLMPWWINLIFSTYSKIYLLLKYRPKINRRALKQQKRGCILVYNHSSNKDHYFVMSACNYRPVNFVLASYFFFNKTLCKILTWARCISKDQFKPDIQAIRKMKKVLEKNGIVAIAPTGQTTMDGKLPFISPSIVKLVRMTKADVMGLRMNGVYLSLPKWRKYPRKTKINLEFVPVVKKEELDNLTDQEIYDRIVKSINVDEYLNQQRLPHKIKGKNQAEGLENLMVRCPKCGSKHSFVTNDNLITCTSCNNQILVNKYGLLEKTSEETVTFETISEHYEWQKEQIGKESESESFTLSTKVQLLSNKFTPNKFELLGEGIIVMNKNECYYEGTCNNEPFRKDFKMEQLTQLPFDPNNHFEVPNEECLYRFKPIEKSSYIVDYVQLIDYLNNNKN